MVVAAGLLLALAAVLLVLEPILRRHATAPAPSALLPDSDDVVDPVQERRDRALAALKEIEFDRATGKLSEEDYGRLHGRYAAEAVAALREADAAAADPVEHLIRRARLERDGGRQRFCTECGASLRGRFCTECGAASAA